MSIDELNHQLDATDDRAEQFELLVAYVASVHTSDPNTALALTRRAERLANGMRDRRRQVLCMILAGTCDNILGGYREALERFERACDLARQLGEQELESRALHGAGVAQTSLGEFPAALESLDGALRLAEGIGTGSFDSSINNSIGIVYSNLGDHTRAIEEFHRAIDAAEPGSRDHIRGTINLGVEYLRLDDFDDACACLERGAALATGIDQRLHAACLVNLGNVLHRLERYEEAAACYRESLELLQTVGDRQLEAHAQLSIGNLYRAAGQQDKALEALWNAWAIGEQTENAARFIDLMIIGEVYLEKGEIERAEEYMLRALQGVQELGHREFEYQFHNSLSLLYETKGELALAFHHHKLHARMKEEVIGNDHQRAMAQMQMRAEIERAERERETMRRKAEELEAEMERKTKELTAMALQMVEKNTFLEELKVGMNEIARSVDPAAGPKLRQLVRQVEGSINVKKEWQAFEEQFEEVHAGFLDRLKEHYPDLTKMELKICTLVMLNLESKEIADILKSSRRTIEWHRLNIRKKLAIPADSNLFEHVASLAGGR